MKNGKSFHFALINSLNSEHWILNKSKVPFASSKRVSIHYSPSILLFDAVLFVFSQFFIVSNILFSIEAQMHWKEANSFVIQWIRNYPIKLFSDGCGLKQRKRQIHYNFLSTKTFVNRFLSQYIFFECQTTIYIYIGSMIHVRLTQMALYEDVYSTIRRTHK